MKAPGNKAAILNHINPTTSEHDWVENFSSFSQCLALARHETRRDQISGEKFKGEIHSSYLGTSGYFSLLDQVGNCFIPNNPKDASLKGLKSSLLEFTDLSQDDRDSLYALRCSLAHDFSFVNKDPERDRKGRYFRRFTVVSDDSYGVIHAADQKWTGDLSDNSPEVFTLVNLEALGDLAEEVVRKLKQLVDTDAISIRLEGGADELNARYGYSIVNLKLLNGSKGST